MAKQYTDIDVTHDGMVATVEIQRPPNNFFDNALINAIADAFEDVDADPNLRAIVLCSQGKTFGAGADFSKPDLNATATAGTGKPLYKEATRQFPTNNQQTQ